jgi:hypothetical protein
VPEVSGTRRVGANGRTKPLVAISRFWSGKGVDERFWGYLLHMGSI